MNKGQKEAGLIVQHWFFKEPHKQSCCICGEPGTGKSYFITQIPILLNLNKNEYLVMSYTGQACNNLIQRNINAKTIHSSILETYLKAKTIDGVPIERGGIPVMIEDFRKVSYIPKGVKLIIIDEASFLPEWLELYLLSYGIKILLIGDYDQLGPVGGKQVFVKERMDYTLTEPMRQDLDSMIYKLTMDIRKNKVRPDNIMQYNKGDVTIIKSNRMPIDKLIKQHQNIFKKMDINITISNKQRQIITEVNRELFFNTQDPRPQLGEKLVCRKNNWNLRVGEHGEFPLVNGTIGTIVRGITQSKMSYKDMTYNIDFKPIYLDDDYFDNLLCDLDFLHQPFGDKMINKYNIGNKLEYAHAITTHLSQGSQFPFVAYFGGFFMDQDMTRRINHVATSRATKHLVWIYPY